MLQKLGRSLSFLRFQERGPDPSEVGAGSLVEALVPSFASWRVQLVLGPLRQGRRANHILFQT
jgi:hypothetical protein